MFFMREKSIISIKLPFAWVNHSIGEEAEKSNFFKFLSLWRERIVKKVSGSHLGAVYAI